MQESSCLRQKLSGKLLCKKGADRLDANWSCVRDAVAKAFLIERNLGSWASVQAVAFTMQCLSNPKVRHDGNNKSNPEFDKYQIIQSKNNFSCTQLSAMGYNTALLKTEFNEEKIRALAEERTISVTVANTCKHQEALQKASTHSKKFHLTSSEHITSVDMLIAAKMGVGPTSMYVTNGGKHSRQSYHLKSLLVTRYLIGNRNGKCTRYLIANRNRKQEAKVLNPTPTAFPKTEINRT